MRKVIHIVACILFGSGVLFAQTQNQMFNVHEDIVKPSMNEKKYGKARERFNAAGELNKIDFSCMAYRQNDNTFLISSKRGDVLAEMSYSYKASTTN